MTNNTCTEILFKPTVDLPVRMRAPAPLSRERPPVSVRMVTMATTVNMVKNKE